MPHTYTNRPRKFANLFHHPEKLGLVHPEQLVKHFRWENINALLYELGGVLFVVASALYLPRFEELKRVASKIIISAALCFLIVSLHDLVEFIYLGKSIRRVDFVALSFYLAGSCCLIIGAVYFLPEIPDQCGYVWFATGSITYIIGSVLNSLLIFESPTRRTAQYFLLTAISFIIGSTMFLVGSTAHYVLDYNDPVDSLKVNAFLACFYIIGSIMFCLGGVFNLLRSRIVMRRDVHRYEHQHPLAALLFGTASEEDTTMYGSVMDSGNNNDKGSDNANRNGDKEISYKDDSET